MLNHTLIVANPKLEKMTPEQRAVLIERLKNGHVYVEVEYDVPHDGSVLKTKTVAMIIDLGPVLFSSIIDASFNIMKSGES